MSTGIPDTSLCCMVGCHNEESRLPQVLAHALLWADEILIVDKGSTDRTAEIARSYGSRVQVLSVPYAPQGEDNLDEWCQHANSEWIFGVTCSEIPTREVIAQAREFIKEPEVDVVYVPRQIHSFGHHHPTSPWSISYYPFLFHRRRAIVRNTIHDNIAARHPDRTRRIPYSSTCCVFHFTHASAAGFLTTVASYAKVEAAQWEIGAIPGKMVHSFTEIRRAIPGILRCGQQAPVILAAWCLYHFAVILHGMERLGDGPAHERYTAEKHRILAQEWGIPHVPQARSSPVAGADASIRLGFPALLRLTCMLCIAILVVAFPSYLMAFFRRALGWAKRRLGQKRSSRI